MTPHDRYGLSQVINAAGSFTPLGVSRSSAGVGRVAGEALTQFFVIDQLQDALSTALSRFTGAEAGVAVHCVAAGITLSIAAVMTGPDPARIAALPNVSVMLALGRIAHDTALTTLGLRKSAFPFAHGAKHALRPDLHLFDSFHCSRYNTNTRRLTTPMFHAVFAAVREMLPPDPGKARPH